MILGVPQNDRIPFQRPKQAGFYTPKFPHPAFQTNLRPFNTFPAVRADRARIPPGPAGLAPGVLTYLGPEQQPQVMPAAQPQAPGMSGFGRGGLGHGPGADPYRTMRTGMMPGIYGDGRNLRYGVTSAGQVVRAQTPSAYGGYNDPAGSTSPIAAQPTPTAPAINGGWMGFGSAFGRSR